MSAATPRWLDATETPILEALTDPSARIAALVVRLDRHRLGSLVAWPEDDPRLLWRYIREAVGCWPPLFIVTVLPDTRNSRGHTLRRSRVTMLEARTRTAGRLCEPVETLLRDLLGRPARPRRRRWAIRTS